MSQVPYNSLLHRIAQLTCAATLLLIFMGGLVTSHQAGMSVPDWPNSYGYNMFTFPISKWVGGIFYEHTHRLMGTVVGMLSIALVIIAWKVESRRWVRWLATSVLGAVIFQGVLGGLRVVLVKLDLAIVHACIAQAFFCLTALVAVVTSRWWLNANVMPAGGNRLIALGSVCVLTIYSQLIVGATMRHYQAGLIIPDVPLSFGKILPPLTEAQYVQAYELYFTNPAVIHPYIGCPTIGQMRLNSAHRIGAIVVSILVLSLIVVVSLHYRIAALRWLAMALLMLLIAQIALGVLTVLLLKPADIASLHVATGALTLMTTFVLLVRSMRLYSPRWRTAPRGFEVQGAPIHSMVPA